MGKVKCKICGHEGNFLGHHITTKHSISVSEYLSRYDNSPIVSDDLQARYKQKSASVARQHPPDPTGLMIPFAGIDFPVNFDVPEDVCLPMPAYYKIPESGQLAKDVSHAAVALSAGRSIYIWGLPGSGKDAFFHAWSALTRTPAIIRQIKPGTDIESWFFSRGFDQNGTFWEEGSVLKALRDGYLTPTGRRIPYLLLVSDFDRATDDQAEHLRLITDSIQGRVDGPAGKVYKTLPGTRVVATANTAGSGDDRGRMVSANPIDASILDRFERSFQFHWMSWEDEQIVAASKFPGLIAVYPNMLERFGKLTDTLRDAILKGDLYAEFSHRGVCTVLGHMQDIMTIQYQGKKPPKDLFRQGVRAWLDGLPDKENRQIATKLIDPHISMLSKGKV